MRRCYRCGEVKPFDADHYGRDRTRKHGLKTLCRVCERASKRKGGEYFYPSNEPPKFTRNTGVHYKTALPPEKWTTIQHFLGELNYYAGLAEKAGVKPNVAQFMAEWGGHTRGREVSR